MPEIHAGAAGAGSALPARLVAAMALSCALAVATIYYHQPLLPQMAAAFGRTPGEASLVATLTQLGYAVGLLLIVPLADSRQPRRLALGAVAANAIALLACAAAPGFAALCAASFAVGATGITAQIIIPAMAGQAALAERGRVVGTLLGGLSTGLLLARTFSGFVGAHAGWRAVFVIAALVDGVLLALVALRLPMARGLAAASWSRLMGSLATLVREERLLLISAASGFLMFASFSALWATLAALLARAPYGFGPAAVGAFGLVALLGIVLSPRIGALVDRIGAHNLVTAGALALAAGFACIAVAGRGIGWLVVGMVLLDLGNRAGLVANQARVQALRPDARSRLNTVFIGSYFLGGAAGAALGSLGAQRAGWPGLAATGALLALAGGAVNLLAPRPAHESPCTSTPNERTCP